MRELTLEEQAYSAGRDLAVRDFEKQAFLGGLLQGGKFLMGMGHLGRAGTLSSRISAHHIGMPVGMGIMGAMGAEEGHRAEGFMKGLAGGLVFNAAMPLGGFIGKRLLAPGFRGSKTLGAIKNMGFSAPAAKRISASQTINRQLHPLARRLSAGNMDAKHFKRLNTALTDAGPGLGTLPAELKSQHTKIQSLLSKGTNLTPAQQKALNSEIETFTKGLYDSGLQTGTLGQKTRLRGVRFAKGLGSAVGGMGLGAMLSHRAEAAMSPGSSFFDAKGGH